MPARSSVRSIKAVNGRGSEVAPFARERLNDCGACGNACPAGAACVYGSCGCPSGEHPCGDGCCPDGQICCDHHCCAAGVTSCASGGCCPTCVPDCTGKACGSDGCGGSCGTCLAGACRPDGTCGCLPPGTETASCSSGSACCDKCVGAATFVCGESLSFGGCCLSTDNGAPCTTPGFNAAECCGGFCAMAPGAAAGACSSVQLRTGEQCQRNADCSSCVCSSGACL